MEMRKFILIIAVILLAGSAYAQLQSNLPLSYAPAKSSFSLFDPSRFHMSQSYSFMFMSSNSGSQSLGMYLNSIEYQVSNPLNIKLDIAYVHQPGAFFNTSGVSLTDGRILPAISISYRPTKNLLFRFNYRQTPLFYQDNNSAYDNNYYSREGDR